MDARLATLAFAALSTLSGCSNFFGDGSMDAHNPGTNLGSFTISATMTSNTCGAGALGEQDSWTFDVHLARDTGVIYWNNGQADISGTLNSDNVTFSFDTSVIQDMRDPNVVGPPPCSIQRADTAQGKLDSPTGTVSSLTGTLSYSFAPTQGSNCDDLVDSDTPLVAQLPCAFSYTMTGTNTASGTGGSATQ